jgi:putative nucleotidyltransferase-like protein
VSRSSRRLGASVAGALRGAWRRSPPPLDIAAEELAAVTPLLLWSGAGGLGWWRVRQSDRRTSPAAGQLQQAHRLHVVQAALHERHIEQAVTLLRSNGIEPLLIKGWAIARSYPAKGIRPYGDIDLCVPTEQYAAAKTLLSREPEWTVDLHDELATLGGESLAALFDRSRLARLGEVEVRVPAAEDHLRILCNHLLRHGAWRPLWLCDVALAVESRPADFDWDRCLGGNAGRADQVTCAIGLAHQLLQAEVDDTPVSRRAEHLPRWLVPTVLDQWGRPPRYRLPMRALVLHPLEALLELRHHWPNGIEATIGMDGPFNELPRLPLQLADAVVRTTRFLTQAPRLHHERH